MQNIASLPATKQRKVIKIYLDAFRRQPVPCGACKHNCCASCSRHNGYLRGTIKEINKLKQEYDYVEWVGYEKETNEYPQKVREGTIDHGFFKANQGCNLPYKLRSPICIGFTCGSMSYQQYKAGATIYKEFSHEV